MKPEIRSTLTLLAMAVIATAAAASEEVIVKSKSSFELAANPDERAIQACADAFMTRLLPESHVRLHLVVPAGPQIFNSSRPPERMDVALSARLKTDGTLLATSTCTVFQNAKIDQLQMRVTNPTRLASTTAKDINLIAASR